MRHTWKPSWSFVPMCVAPTLLRADCRLAPGWPTTMIRSAWGAEPAAPLALEEADSPPEKVEASPGDRTETARKAGSATSLLLVRTPTNRRLPHQLEPDFVWLPARSLLTLRANVYPRSSDRRCTIHIGACTPLRRQTPLYACFVTVMSVSISVLSVCSG